MLLLTFAVGVRCFTDFGQGLKQSKLAGEDLAFLSTSCFI